MPVDLNNIIKFSSSCAYDNKIVNNLCSGPIQSAALMTVVIILLIMIMCPCKKNTSMLVFGKLGFYIFLFSFVIMFVHDGIVSTNYQKKYGDTQNEHLIRSFSGGNNPVYSSDDIDVVAATGDDVHKMSGSDETSSPYVENTREDDTENIFVRFGV